MARHRTFIALPLETAVRDRIVSVQEKLAASSADVKWVEPENLHVTLLFLGEVDDGQLVSVCRVVTDLCSVHAQFSVGIEGVGSFPDVRRPRILWAGVGDGSAELAALHGALEVPLLELGCYRREERRYTPHITLGRVKSERPDADLVAAVGKLGNWKGPQWQAREVHVLNSQLTARGPAYAVMSRAKLME